jgi:hypothetical protein
MDSPQTLQAILAQAQEVAVPLSTQWMPTLVLTIVWIFVAAAVVGALARYFGRGRES